jgi:hypothetical protein
MMAVRRRWHVIVAKLMTLNAQPLGISIALHSDLSEFF